MQFKTRAMVKLMKPSKGDYEGEPYDNTKVYVESEFKKDSEGFGIPQVSYNWGTSDNYYQFRKDYPEINTEFLADIVMNNESTGTSSILTIDSLQPAKK